jgi:hypothetical protein
LKSFRLEQRANLMNAARYKLMLSYLPGMAAIVNSFESPEVQRSVYESLMEALNVRMDAESPGAGADSNNRHRTSSKVSRTPPVKVAASTDSDVIATIGDLAHDLKEGDSIHSLMMEQHVALP